MVVRNGRMPNLSGNTGKERGVKVKLKLPKPHVEPKHVKHTAGLTIVSGTLLEMAHMFYPSGLILLGIGGLIAVYEPYFVFEVKEIELNHD